MKCLRETWWLIGTELFTVRETEGLRKEKKKRQWMEMIDLLKWEKKTMKDQFETETIERIEVNKKRNIGNRKRRIRKKAV